MDYTFWIPLGISILALVWNFFQQKWIKNLEHENERASLVHRIQFEKEFEIYNDLWGKLIDLRNITGQLRPQLEYVDINKSPQDTVREKLNIMNEAFNACVLSFDKNKPFYDKDIYEEVERAIRLSRREATEFQHADNRSAEYWENAKKNIDGILNSMDKTCELIRKRIGLIKVR